MPAANTLLRRCAATALAVADRVSGVGVHAEMPAEQVHRVRLSNIVAAMVSLLLLPYMGFFAATGLTGNALIQVFGMCGLLGVIGLNALGWHRTARLLTLLVGNALVLVMAVRLGRASGIHFYGFAAVIAPLFFYSKRDWPIIAGCVSLTVAIMLWGHVALTSQLPYSPLPADIAEVFYILSAAGGLATTFAFVLYFYAESSRLADSLTAANAQMKQLSETDELTQLANRRKIGQITRQEWSRAVRGNYPLAVAMLDVDHFKSYNDLYGHLAGDLALARIAAALRSAIHRPYDLAGRLGGEEFLLLLPESDAAGAELVADRARRMVEALAIPHAGNSASAWLTCSVGVCSLRPVAGGDPDLLQRLADSALYRAKELGRNRVVVAKLEDEAGEAVKSKADVSSS